MKKALALLTVALIVVSMFSMLAPKGIAEGSVNSNTTPGNYTPIVPEERFGSAEVLVIEDIIPWYTGSWPCDTDAVPAALNTLGKTYDLIHSDHLAITDLTAYKIVILASTQDRSTYVNIDAHIDKINAFVSGGGIYVCHACDYGWGYPGAWSDWSGLQIMPEGVTHVAGYYTMYIHITNLLSPIVAGLNDAYFAGWGYSAHGYFTNVPAGADTVMVTYSDLPTYIVYSYGSGKVLATMQTVEWGWGGVYGWVGGFRKEFLLNEISYAQTLAAEVHLPVPFESQGNAYWCSVASTCMVLRYYGKNVHIWDISNDIAYGGYFGPAMVELYINLKYPSEFETEVVRCWDVTDETRAEIESNLIQDYPIILDLWLPLGHMVVVVGFNSTGFFINDPSGALFESLGKPSQAYDIHRYVSWEELKPKITDGFLGMTKGTFLVVKETASPIEATLWTRNGDLLHPDWSWIRTYHGLDNSRGVAIDYGLPLQGMFWRMIGLHQNSWDTEDTLTYTYAVFNHKDKVSSFDSVFRIKGVNGVTYYEYESNNIQAAKYDYTLFGGPGVALKDCLPSSGFYVASCELYDHLTGALIDSFELPKIYYGRSLLFFLDSPADILVTNPEGLRVGFDIVNQRNVCEIFGAYYSGNGSEPQAISIPDPVPGIYRVEAFGTDVGPYTLTFCFYDSDGSLIGSQTYSGEIVEGAVYVYSAILSDGVMTTNPDPIAELRHLKEFIDPLPPENFKYPKLARYLKKALSNKIDEVILKVEAGNYTDAINKLLYDIRAKMDGDSTAEDWIKDPTTQLKFCLIIDHIIESIKILQENN